MLALLPVLAAAKTPPWAQVLTWLALLIGAALVLGLAILFLRRSLLAKDTGADQTGLLATLRQMRDDGRISPEEFDAARRRMAARAAGRDPDAPAPPKPAPQRPAPARPPAPPGELRSRPGFDLTGAPLPKPAHRPAKPE